MKDEHSGVLILCD